MMNHTHHWFWPYTAYMLCLIHVNIQHTLWSDSQRVEVDVIDLIVCCSYGQNQCCLDSVPFHGAWEKCQLMYKMMLGDMCAFVSYQKQMICEEGLKTQGLMKTQFLILSLNYPFMVSVLLCKKKKKKIEITEPEQNTAKTKSKRFLLRNMIRMYRNSGLVSYTSQRLLISK